MKTAILISGELRTFQMCRKTMTFLDDPNVDIFVSTWDQSIINNERLNLHINDSITKEHIQDILQKDATILVEPSSCFESRRYNDKMIHRWLAGFEMIRSSLQKYDYVMVIRPDLFFHEEVFSIDSLILNGDKQFAWYEKDSVLQDCLFFGTYETMDSLFSRLTVLDWLNSEEGDWHTWWKHFVGSNNKKMCEWGKFIFCRPIAKEGMGYRQIYQCYEDWRDLEIVKQIELGNRDMVVNSWGNREVEKAELKSFEHYKIKKQKVAVLVCGMIRQIEISVPSWAKLKQIDADWYLSTWDKSCQSFSSEIFTAIIDDKFLSLFNFYNIASYEEDEQFKSYMLRGGSNSLRYLYLLNKFRDELSVYDKIIIIRPDTFIHITSLEKFTHDYLANLDGMSNIAYENFMQDFMFIVPKVFFERLDVVNAWASNDSVFNPHTKWPEYFKILGLKIRQSSTFNVTLVRPNSRGKSNLSLTAVHSDWDKWDKWHTS